VHLFNQLVHVSHGSELIHDISVIRDIIAIVIVRALEARAKPQCVNAELTKIVKFTDYSLQITDAVVVAVHETARIDLVYRPACKVSVFVD
jgi:NADH/NAD ratio-sensing transcriptional regulator Rex